LKDLPAQILTATIWAYWLGVGVMIVRVRRHARKSRTLRVLVPEDRLERYMWVIWVPLVAAWNLLPYLALSQTHPLLAVPDFARELAPYAAFRWLAAVCAVLLLALTVECWARMGRNWRMGVSLEQHTELVTQGLYRSIRHPIYTLSILLMFCSVGIIPTLPMLVIAAAHVTLMVLKARNEERHLRRTHGDAYAAYAASTGRFFPRLTSRRP